MPRPTAKENLSDRCGNPLSAKPLTLQQLVRGIVRISPDDVEKVLASKPGKGKKK